MISVSRRFVCSLTIVLVFCCSICSIHAAAPEKILYIRADFEDKPIGISDSLWQSRVETLDEYAEDFWVHNTYGNISSFDSSITEAFTLGPALTEDSPYGAGANIYAIRSAMVSAASNAGWNVQSYDQVILLFPGVPEFPAGALGTPGTVWLPGNNPFDGGYVHEFGHALGLGHAHHWEGGEAVYPGEVRGGRDGLWMMGSEGGVNQSFDGRRSPINLPMRYKIGAVDEQLVNRTDESGIFRIYDFAREDIDDDISLGRSLATVFDHDGREFWVSFAPDLSELWEGYNAQGWTNGIVVSDLIGGITHSLDFTPGSQGGTGNEEDYIDSRDGALLVGESYTFPGSELTLEPLQTGVSTDGVRWIDLRLSFSNDDFIANGDFNSDTIVDVADYKILLQNLHTDVSTLGEPEAFELGDITLDLQINYQDVVAFIGVYEAIHGQGSAASLSASIVPEPPLAYYLLMLAVGTVIVRCRSNTFSARKLQSARVPL